LGEKAASFGGKRPSYKWISTTQRKEEDNSPLTLCEEQPSYREKKSSQNLRPRKGALRYKIYITTKRTLFTLEKEELNMSEKKDSLCIHLGRGKLLLVEGTPLDLQGITTRCSRKEKENFHLQRRPIPLHRKGGTLRYTKKKQHLS